MDSINRNKTTSLRNSFLYFLTSVIVGIFFAITIPYMLLSLLTNMGVVTLANYSETQAKAIAPILSNVPDITTVELPMNTTYLLTDKNFKIIDSNMTKESQKNALLFAKGRQYQSETKTAFLLVTRKNEFCILEYHIESLYTNPWMEKHLPAPETCCIILLLFNILLVCILLVTGFSKKIRKQLTPILDAIEQIKQQNLNFTIGTSKIKEFEEILISFNKMKVSLKESLLKEWKANQRQREQIASLAHDIKTPLTVIQGNTELLQETPLTEEQTIYSNYILNSSIQIQTYIKILIDISKAASGYQLQLEDFVITDFINQLKPQISALTAPKHINLKLIQQAEQSILKVDYLLFQRAILNVISNAVDFTPENGTILIETQTLQSAEEHFLKISISDNGPGFSKEALAHGIEQFFMGDTSRNSKTHFGMGLYITDCIVKQHNGQLRLKKSEALGGGNVEIFLKV